MCYTMKCIIRFGLFKHYVQLELKEEDYFLWLWLVIILLVLVFSFFVWI